MGVLGFAPFIQKTCPEVIKTLPNRLRSLSGKTVVLDGTLITQRLHFAPMPHRYRHVLGWYRIIRELRECDVHAICVFDGKERSLAKEMEIKRRRAVRKVTEARGELELQRLGRLQRLTSLLHSWRALNTPAQNKAADSLRSLVGELVNLPPLPSYMTGTPRDDTPNTLLHYNAHPWHVVPSEEAMGDFSQSDMDDVLKHAGVPVNASQDADSMPFADGPGTSEYTTNPVIPPLSGRDGPATNSVETATVPPVEQPTDSSDDIPHLRDLSLHDVPDLEEVVELDDETSAIASTAPELDDLSSPPMPIPTDLETESEQVDPEDLSSALSELYLQYRQSVPELTSLPEQAPAEAVTPEAEASVDEDAAASAADAQAEYAMSKTQHQLMLDEGQLWAHLAEADLGDAEITAVAALTHKSSIISESYKRRTHPPTIETYTESREILEALGVPCIEPTGPFEAEALASSLVINGYADYVASEDTDVLVYEAPLIRNISNRSGPLVVISGTDVRELLALDRAGFVDFALLLGTDFSSRIKNVGPSRALALIREHGSIERVLEQAPQFPPRTPQDVYLAQVDRARLVFETLPSPPDASSIEMKDPDEEEVSRIMKHYGLSSALKEEWDGNVGLEGNYFQDDPSAS
ncbi:PIN domain-like protein [Sparassis latifolia]